MKVTLLGSFPTCMPLYESLLSHKQLHSMCFEESTVHILGQEHHEFIQVQELPIFTINRENIATKFKQWLKDQNTDLVIVCGCSLKIPEALLSIPTYGFLNIHFGKLPENRGPDPLFWSIKEGKKQTAITIHKMDAHWDTGKILIEQAVSIIPGETLGMANSKMSYMLTDLIQKAIELTTDTSNFKPQNTTEVAYYKRPNEKDTTISWETQTADEIENLINACNPKYGGATTYYKESPIKILEASPVDSQPIFGKTAGEIVHAHPQEGLYVYCKYGKILRINIVSSGAGILSGTKFVHLGIQQGHCFTNNIAYKQRSVVS
ncbi:formyltransferase family protein [uncultured Aquimarina sp.]|uniref:methionyl-tRNA formyltransferase n=1 Tax=uncultured Aquimarina sp. TaxID=575652 RepID=UPI00261256FA|nr:formyltransferase family protein [uncultured Aquimarina sp.]